MTEKIRAPIRAREEGKVREDEKYGRELRGSVMESKRAKRLAGKITQKCSALGNGAWRMATLKTLVLSASSRDLVALKEAGRVSA